MSDQRFRFRLPWLSTATAPRPTQESPAPRIPTGPTQPTIIPFRPPGFGQIQVPPHPQGRPESVSSSPTRAPSQTQPGSVPSSPVRAASKPSSPVRAPIRAGPSFLAQLPIRAPTQPTTTSVPPSPTRVSQPPSPVRATIKPGPVAVSEPSTLAPPQPATKSVPSSPVRDVSQPQPTPQTTIRRPFGLIPQRERMQPEKPAAEVKPITPLPSAPKEIQPEVEKQPLPPPSVYSKEEPKPQLFAKEQTQPAIRPEAEERPQPPALFTSRPEAEERPQPPPLLMPRPEAEERPQPPPLFTSRPEAEERPQRPPSFASQPTLIHSMEEPGPPLSAREQTQRAKEHQGVSESILRERIAQKIAPDAVGTERRFPADSDEVKEAKDAKKVEEQFHREEKINHAAIEAEKVQKKWQGDSEIPSKMPTAVNGEYIKMVSATPPRARTPPENHQKPTIHTVDRVPAHKEIRDDIFKLIRKLGSGQAKSLADEYPVSVVTLSGDNKGASMNVGTESLKKDGFLNIHRAYKVKPKAKSDAEETSNDEKSKHPSTKEDATSKTYINSNTQSINNSLMFHSSVKENDPGVKLNLSQSPAVTSKSGIITEPFETKRAEFRATPSEKLTYEPMIQRRCLRGLMMESSDSDDDGQLRKHGCRYSCGAKFANDDDEIDEM